LVVKGHRERGQRRKDILYVDFGAARDTYMKIRKVKIDELIQKLKYPFAR
jgi:hypothetical protein